MSLYDVLRKRDPLDVEGYAGGTLREQLNRSPRVSFGAGGLTGLKPIKPEEPTINPNISMRPASPPPEPNPYENYRPTPSAPPPINVRIGASTEGLNPLDKSQTLLNTQRQVAQDFPSSQMTNEGQILPPKMHHGFKDRLKSGLKGLVINMGEYARTHPGAELPELLGSGGAGAAVGGISPITIDRQVANAAVARREDELGRQIQLDTMRQKPLNETERIRLEAERQAETARREDERLRETADYHKATIEERKNRPRAERQAERNVVNGKIVERQPDGSWKVAYEPPASEKAAKPDLVGQRQSADRQRKHDAAARELESLIEGEKNAASQKDAAYAEFGDLQAKYAAAGPEERAQLKPLLDAAEGKAKAAQARYASFGEKKTKAQKAIDENAEGKMDATEQKIFNAAKAKGLDPDKAVQVYRSGKY